ncbi:MAG: hypothetical protein HRT35_17745 [Algicola sp.]|nr:hypothetical protein [Algicola sp.]
MKTVEECDSRKVICFECGLTDATYLLRDVDFIDKSGTVNALWQWQPKTVKFYQDTAGAGIENSG